MDARFLNASHIGKRVKFESESGAILEDVLISLMATREAVHVELATVTPANAPMMRAHGFSLELETFVEVLS